VTYLSIPPSGSLADPPASSAILPAVEWVQGLLLGTVATSVAVIAVAATGFLMLSGRIDARRGLITIIGCFILFGAPAIARGLRAAAGDGEIAANQPIDPPPPLLAPPTPPKPNVFDPYAGASLQR
jgi:type IV secretory pathway VirB2 component (pilin)